MVINGVWWDVCFVSPHSKKLIRSDGSYSVGVTDSTEQTIYISDMLQGAFLRKVICHEIVHAFIFSNGIYIPLEEEDVLEYVKRTNPDIADEKLKEEICRNNSTANALIHIIWVEKYLFF